MDSIISDLKVYILQCSSTLSMDDDVIALPTPSSNVILSSTSCSRCTFINVIGRLDCEICGNALRVAQPSQSVIDLTVEEVEVEAVLDPMSAPTLGTNDIDCDIEGEEDVELSSFGVEARDQEILVIEVSGRRFGSTSKRGKNKFCGEISVFYYFSMATP